MTPDVEETFKQKFAEAVYDVALEGELRRVVDEK